VRRYIKLEKRGDEHVGLCPFHSETTPSFTVNDKKQFYHCFGCEAHGDVIDFLVTQEHIDFKEACTRLNGPTSNGYHPAMNGHAAPANALPPPVTTPTEMQFPEIELTEAMIPIAGHVFTAWNPKAKDGKGAFHTYKPVLVHPYRDATGALLGIVVRLPIRKKTYVTLRGAERAGAPILYVKAMDEPRPLYGLDLLAQASMGEILIVEGEKTAEAARRLLPNTTVMTWPGGAKAMKQIDWSPLAGRDVLLWGDADKPGHEAMFGYMNTSTKVWRPGIIDILKDAGVGTIRVIPWDETKPDGWDLADAEQEGQTAAQIEAYAAAHATIVWDSTAPAPPPRAAVAAAGARPFRILGYNHGAYFYLPAGAQQIVEMPPAAHTQYNLFQLAPLDYWASIAPPDVRNIRGGKFDQTQAVDSLMQEAVRVGIFNENRLRGRGAWLDAGRPVIHLGHVICVGPDRYRPSEMPSDFIYPAADPLDLAVVAPASNQQANQLVSICEAVTWENKISGKLLAGWCVVAMVCGALQWRPHIWLTGSATSGKSTVLEEIVMRLLRKVALKRDGRTTEANIRQTLHRDALPVIIDEAEPTKESEARMRNLLDFARVSSDGGSIGKGTPGGNAINYVARSCFMFASINTALQGYADMTRVSKLVLRKHPGTDAEREAHYAALVASINNTLTPDYAAAMYARSVANLDVLLENSQTFIDACAEVLHQRRAAKQIGSMLAGLYLCYSTGKVTKQDALNFVKKHAWDDHIANPDSTDDNNLLRYITSQRRRVPGDHGSTREVTIGELIALCMGDAIGDIGVTEAAAHHELGRIGIKIFSPTEMFTRFKQPAFVIANQSDELAKVLANTAWHAEWARPLTSLPGAMKERNIYRFSPGLVGRGTVIPYALVQGPKEGPEPPAKTP